MATSTNPNLVEEAGPGNLKQAEDEISRFAHSFGLLRLGAPLTSAHAKHVFQVIMNRLIEIAEQECSLDSFQSRVKRFRQNEGVQQICIETRLLSSFHAKRNLKQTTVAITIRAAGFSSFRRVHRLKWVSFAVPDVRNYLFGLGEFDLVTSDRVET